MIIPQPIVVDWQVTASCTRKCSFCYGPRDVEELNTDDALSLVDIISAAGTRVVGITGGEPLTRVDLPQILRRIKEKGMAVCLSTNCDLYQERRPEIRPYIDTLGLPIEGATSRIHDSLRGKGSFHRVMSVLRQEAHSSEMRFRIGTVVTGINYHDLYGIEGLLTAFASSIVYWKLYEYIDYHSQSQPHRVKVAPANAVCAEVAQLGKLLPSDMIVYDSPARRHASYLLIKPNGNVFIPSLVAGVNRENILGNLLSNPRETIDKWSNVVDVRGYSDCVRCIYRKDVELSKRFLQSGDTTNDNTAN